MKWHRKTTSFGIWDDEGRRVAVIVQDHPNEAMNSRLIESAPQLLKALEKIDRYVTDCNERGASADEWLVVECARTAIAAATGPDIRANYALYIAENAYEEAERKIDSAVNSSEFDDADTARESARKAMIFARRSLREETERAAAARRNEERACGICKRNSDGKNTLEDGRPVCGSCEEMLID